jgi:hypothetical protein
LRLYRVYLVELIYLSHNHCALGKVGSAFYGRFIQPESPVNGPNISKVISGRETRSADAQVELVANDDFLYRDMVRSMWVALRAASPKILAL